MFTKKFAGKDSQIRESLLFGWNWKLKFTSFLWNIGSPKRILRVYLLEQLLYLLLRLRNCVGATGMYRAKISQNDVFATFLKKKPLKLVINLFTAYLAIVIANTIKKKITKKTITAVSDRIKNMKIYWTMFVKTLYQEKLSWWF